MSKETVQLIIGRAVTDAAFRKALFTDPGKACAGYDLNDEEQALLSALDAEQVTAFAGALDQRLSKTMFGTMGMPEGGSAPDGQIYDI